MLKAENEELLDNIIKAINTLNKKIDELMKYQNNRMLNATETAEYLGMSPYELRKERGRSYCFPKPTNSGKWAQGWLDEWKSQR